MSVFGDQHFAWNSLLDDLLHSGFASIPESLGVIAEGFDEVRSGLSCTACCSVSLLRALMKSVLVCHVLLAALSIRPLSQGDLFAWPVSCLRGE